MKQRGAEIRSELLHIQPYEFETLLFSNPDILGRNLYPDHLKMPTMQVQVEKAVSAFKKILEEAGFPEEINDGIDSAPSKRILTLAPDYRKRADGLRIARTIGLDAIRRQCPQFSAWISAMEGLSVG